MFTGIVQGVGFVRKLDNICGNLAYTLEFPLHLCEGLVLGASVAINGTCQTVVAYDPLRSWVSFEAIPETLNKTNLKALCLGSGVHIERALKVGDEIGGHLLSGHIMATASLLKVDPIAEQGYCLTLSIPASCRHYMIPKGFIAVDGVSLTLGEIGEQWFQVYLIPYTLEHTLFKEKKVGDNFNIEIDVQSQMIVDTVNRVLKEQGVLSYANQTVV